jgi:3-hydroxyacyl-CoA dehydrogenase, NAD binding domain
MGMPAISQIWAPGLHNTDGVSSAPLQNLKIKQQIFADLERACRKDAILSTNTSTINIELVGAKTQVRAHISIPGRVCEHAPVPPDAAPQRVKLHCPAILAGRHQPDTAGWQ